MIIVQTQGLCYNAGPLKVDNIELISAKRYREEDMLYFRTKRSGALC